MQRIISTPKGTKYIFSTGVIRETRIQYLTNRPPGAVEYVQRDHNSLFRNTGTFVHLCAVWLLM